MANAKRKKQTNRYKDDEVLVISKVCKIEIQNQIINEKYKTVFYCPSYEKPEGRMCVVWGRTTFKVGDEVQMSGRFSDGVFLVWRLMYKRSEDNK